MIRPDQDIKNADWLKRKGQVEKPAPNRLPIRTPTRFIATIGGFDGTHYEVRWSHGKLLYRTDDLEVSVVPSVQDWESFWNTMDRIQVWTWNACYDDLETCDGTQWTVAIKKGSRSVQCFGSNAYPAGYKEFREAVGMLIGRPFER